MANTTNTTSDPTAVDTVSTVTPVSKEERYVNYENHNNYYAGNEVSIFFNHVWVKDIDAVSFKFATQDSPVYGYAREAWGAMTKGTVFVEGALVLPFLGPDYIFRIMRTVWETYNNIAAKRSGSLQFTQASKFEAEYKQILEDLGSSNTKDTIDAAEEKLKDLRWGDKSEVNTTNIIYRIDQLTAKLRDTLSKSGDIPPLDITIKYGTGDRTKIQKLNDVRFIGYSQEIANSGQPIQDVIQFIARDINSPEASKYSAKQDNLVFSKSVDWYAISYGLADTLYKKFLETNSSFGIKAEGKLVTKNNDIIIKEDNDLFYMGETNVLNVEIIKEVKPLYSSIPGHNSLLATGKGIDDDFLNNPKGLLSDNRTSGFKSIIDRSWARNMRISADSLDNIKMYSHVSGQETTYIGNMLHSGIGPSITTETNYGNITNTVLGLGKMYVNPNIVYEYNDATKLTPMGTENTTLTFPSSVSYMYPEKQLTPFPITFVPDTAKENLSFTGLTSTDAVWYNTTSANRGIESPVTVYDTKAIVTTEKLEELKAFNYNGDNILLLINGEHTQISKCITDPIAAITNNNTYRIIDKENGDWGVSLLPESETISAGSTVSVKKLADSAATIIAAYTPNTPISYMVSNEISVTAKDERKNSYKESIAAFSCLPFTYERTRMTAKKHKEPWKGLSMWLDSLTMKVSLTDIFNDILEDFMEGDTTNRTELAQYSIDKLYDIFKKRMFRLLSAYYLPEGSIVSLLPLTGTDDHEITFMTTPPSISKKQMLSNHQYKAPVTAAALPSDTEKLFWHFHTYTDMKRVPMYYKTSYSFATKYGYMGALVAPDELVGSSANIGTTALYQPLSIPSGDATDIKNKFKTTYENDLIIKVPTTNGIVYCEQDDIKVTSTKGTKPASYDALYNKLHSSYDTDENKTTLQSIVDLISYDHFTANPDQIVQMITWFEIGKYLIPYFYDPSLFIKGVDTIKRPTLKTRFNTQIDYLNEVYPDGRCYYIFPTTEVGYHTSFYNESNLQSDNKTIDTNISNAIKAITMNNIPEDVIRINNIIKQAMIEFNSFVTGKCTYLNNSYENILMQPMIGYSATTTKCSIMNINENIESLMENDAPDSTTNTDTVLPVISYVNENWQLINDITYPNRENLDGYYFGSDPTALEKKEDGVTIAPESPYRILAGLEIFISNPNGTDSGVLDTSKIPKDMSNIDGLENTIASLKTKGKMRNYFGNKHHYTQILIFNQKTLKEEYLTHMTERNIMTMELLNFNILAANNTFILSDLNSALTDTDNIYIDELNKRISVNISYMETLKDLVVTSFFGGTQTSNNTVQQLGVDYKLIPASEDNPFSYNVFDKPRIDAFEIDTTHMDIPFLLNSTIAYTSSDIKNTYEAVYIIDHNITSLTTSFHFNNTLGADFNITSNGVVVNDETKTITIDIPFFFEAGIEATTTDNDKMYIINSLVINGKDINDVDDESCKIKLQNSIHAMDQLKDVFFVDGDKIELLQSNDWSTVYETYTVNVISKNSITGWNITPDVTGAVAISGTVDEVMTPAELKITAPFWVEKIKETTIINEFDNFDISSLVDDDNLTVCMLLNNTKFNPTDWSLMTGDVITLKTNSGEYTKEYNVRMAGDYTVFTPTLFTMEANTNLILDTPSIIDNGAIKFIIYDGITLDDVIQGDKKIAINGTELTTSPVDEYVYTDILDGNLLLRNNNAETITNGTFAITSEPYQITNFELLDNSADGTTLPVVTSVIDQTAKTITMNIPQAYLDQNVLISDQVKLTITTNFGLNDSNVYVNDPAHDLTDNDTQYVAGDAQHIGLEAIKDAYDNITLPADNTSTSVNITGNNINNVRQAGTTYTLVMRFVI